MVQRELEQEQLRECRLYILHLIAVPILHVRSYHVQRHRKAEQHLIWRGSGWTYALTSELLGVFTIGALGFRLAKAGVGVTGYRLFAPRRCSCCPCADVSKVTSVWTIESWALVLAFAKCKPDLTCRVCLCVCVCFPFRLPRWCE